MRAPRGWLMGLSAWRRTPAFLQPWLAMVLGLLVATGTGALAQGLVHLGLAPRSVLGWLVLGVTAVGQLLGAVLVTCGLLLKIRHESRKLREQNRARLERSQASVSPLGVHRVGSRARRGR